MDLQLMLNLLHTLEWMRKHERWTRPQLEMYQAESLDRLRQYAYAHSPFYQRHHKGLFDRPLHELPVLTKATLMENFNDLITDREVSLDSVREYVANDQKGHLYLNRYWVNATSGSTGRPAFFLFNRDEWIAILASFGRAHEWAGVQVGLTHRMKMASVASTSPSHMSALVSATLQSWWLPNLRLAASEPLESIGQRLNAWQPEILVSYASMARILADEQLAGRLRIQPHLVFTSSEVLTEETRRRIDKAWGHLPFDQYAATETGSIAAETTDHCGLQLFEDNLITEVVDEQYRPVPPGVYGEKLLVTALFNRTQPLIRYELNDSVRLATGAVAAKWPFARIDGIQGRAEDILHLPAISGGEVAVHPLTFHRVLDSLPVSGWQVVQDGTGLQILLSGAQNGANDAMLVDSLTRALGAQNVIVPSIAIQHVPTLSKTASGKAPLIKAYRPSQSN